MADRVTKEQLKKIVWWAIIGLSLILFWGFVWAVLFGTKPVQSTCDGIVDEYGICREHRK